MTTVRRIMANDRLDRNTTVIADEGPSLIACNLPPRQSVSELEPSRMSYYNGNEDLSVPFKWEATPGMPIVDHSSAAGVRDDQDSGRLLLRPPPSASNSPLNPAIPVSAKDQQKLGLPPKSRSYSKLELMSFTSSRSSGSSTTADSGSAHLRARSKSSMGRRSDFDWPEVSDDECTSPRRTDPQEPAASSSSTSTGKQWSFSSRSYSSTSRASQTPSPVSSGDDAVSSAEGYKRDLLALSNLVNFSAATAVEPANSDGSSESTEVSEDCGSESFERAFEIDDHVRPLGFLSCMPIFSSVRMIQSTFGSGDKQKSAMINCSKGLTPGSRNKGYRPNNRLARGLSL